MNFPEIQDDLEAATVLLVMECVSDIYNMGSEDDPLQSLKDYLGDRANVISLYVDAEGLSDDHPYEKVRDVILTRVAAKLISNAYKKSIIEPEPLFQTRIQRFFEAIKPKQDDNDKGQNAEELCERFNVEWDTVKNFRRHDRLEIGGVVRSKMDKVTRTIYVFRDPSKLFYGKVDRDYCPELDEIPDDFIRTPDFSSSDK